MKLKISLGALCIAMLIFTISSVNIKNTVFSVNDSDYEATGNVGKISEGTIIEYNYKAKGEIVEGYEFSFATYGEKLKKGMVYVEVYDKQTTKLIGKGSIKANAIEDNELTMIKTNRIKLGKKDVRVVVYCEDFEEDKQLTMWLGESKENENGLTKVNGVGLESNLLIFSRIVKKEAPYTWDMILLTSICFVAFCSVPVVKDNQMEAEDGVEEETAET